MADEAARGDERKRDACFLRRVAPDGQASAKDKDEWRTRALTNR